MEKKKAIIIDLEGTLSDHSHRVHHYVNKDYDEYNKLFPDDPVNSNFMGILLKIKNDDPDIKIILCTAKTVRYDEDVLSWLKKNNFSGIFNKIYFRKINDNRPSIEVKQDMVDELKQTYDIVLAYDDREDMCKMFASNGIEAIQVYCSPKVKGEPIYTPVAQRLVNFANTHEEKNKEYGDGYKDFGKIMMALFPGGLHLNSEQDFTRFAMLNIKIAKVDRYCKNFTKGGHSDSLTDISVYSAMLQEVDDGL